MKYNKFIDHTLLKADATILSIETLCNEAIEHNFASVCVNPAHVAYCSEKLRGTDVKVCTVVGFPLGATTTSTKVAETSQAIIDGASEIDMVINIGALKSRDNDFVENDIRQVVKAAKGSTVKVIIETCLLTEEEKVLACQLSVAAGAHFVKTSTGFGTGGATVDDVKLMANTVVDKCLVKASGGVKTLEDMEKMIAAGASRIGTSNGVALIANKAVKNSY